MVVNNQVYADSTISYIMWPSKVKAKAPAEGCVQDIVTKQLVGLPDGWYSDKFTLVSTFNWFDSQWQLHLVALQQERAHAGELMYYATKAISSIGPVYEHWSV